MGFFEPAPPPFDLEDWKTKPHLARLKPLVQDWGANGFGSPTFVYFIYVFKLIVFSVAALFVISLTPGLGSLGDLSDLAGTTTTLLLFVFITVNVAVLVLRRSPVEHEHFVAPTVVPILAIVILCGLLARRADDNPEYFLYAGGLVLLGVILSALNILFTGKRPDVDHPERFAG